MSKPLLCKLGLHNEVRLLWAGDIHEDETSGEILRCRRCGRYRKWGTARWPEYILKRLEAKG